jgi:hypothetical protein
MNYLLKFMLIGLLSLLSGVAFAYPLYYNGVIVVPLNRMPEGPKPDLTMDLNYANFTLQPYDQNMQLPEWYNISQRGEPSILSFQLVMNVTNISNQTAIIDMFSLCSGNRTISGSSFFEIVDGERSTVEGVWLDGEWVNITWIPPQNNLPGYWRQGVDIERSFIHGKLTSVIMSINGSYIDVTERVRLADKDTIMQMGDSIVMFDLIASGEINFFNPQNWQPSSELPEYSVTNVNLNNGFNNRWLTNQSRLIMLNGTLPISASALPNVLEYLKSNQTLVRIQASTEFENSYINSILVNTHLLETVLNVIKLETISNNHQEYNNLFGNNQVLQLDQFGVEVFLQPRS